METNPISETLCFLDYTIPDYGQVQKPSDSQSFVPMSEPLDCTSSFFVFLAADSDRLDCHVFGRKKKPLWVPGEHILNYTWFAA
jgi:hypothetical protein